jgi:hypothetical protein
LFAHVNSKVELFAATVRAAKEIQHSCPHATPRRSK